MEIIDIALEKLVLVHQKSLLKLFWDDDGESPHIEWRHFVMRYRGDRVGAGGVGTSDQ